MTAEACALRSSGAWSTAGWAASRLASRQISCSSRCADLPSLLQKELDFESESARDEPSALENVPSGWTLDAQADATTLRLTKKGNGEDVIVSISTLGQEESMEDGEEEEGEEGQEATPAYSINFSADCKRGSKVLRFSLIYIENDTEGPTIQHVSIIPDGMQDDEDAEFYTGPEFSELDSALQEEFAGYVERLGIDADLCQYLCRLVYDKEQVDYVRWMNKVLDFVKK